MSFGIPAIEKILVLVSIAFVVFGTIQFTYLALDLMEKGVKYKCKTL